MSSAPPHTLPTASVLCDEDESTTVAASNVDVATADVLHHFSWVDHLVFSMMLIASALIGVYFACFGGRQKTAAEFLVGNRKMSIFPIAMSLAASFTSGIMLLGIPLEIYRYGTQQYLILFGLLCSTITIIFLYMPIFYDLQLTSSYEYLERRFNKKIRILGSFLFFLSSLFVMPIVLYGPALVYNQVTGISVSLIIPIVSIVCMFYTTVGGLKAVVWTDTLQMILVYVALVFTAIKSTLDVGGIEEIWTRGWSGGRMEIFNMDANPTTRHTFWTTFVGGYIYCLSGVSNHQAMIQRYVSLPSKNHARRALVLYAIGVFVLVNLLTYIGLAAYALYYRCDPITAKHITNPDQLLPYLVMHTSGHIPAIPGLFVAGMFSAALSTVSTGLNSLAATTFEDFIKGAIFPSRHFSETTSASILKCIVFVYGAICVAMTYVVAQLGALLQIAMSLLSMTTGPIFGIFNLGLLVPWANSQGTLIGGISGILISGIVVFGAQAYIYLGKITHPTLELSTCGCNWPSLASTENLTSSAILYEVSSKLNPPNGNSDYVSQYSADYDEEVFALFHLSYMYYAALGCFTTFLIGAIISYFTGGQDQNQLDPRLVAPFLHRFLLESRIQQDDAENELKERKKLIENDTCIVVTVTPAAGECRNSQERQCTQ